MAAEPIQDTPPEGGDPLEEEPVAEEETPVEGELTEAEGNLDESGVDDFLTGTPFKNGAAMRDGYKEIQRLVASKDRKMAELQRQLETAIAAVQQLSGKGKEEDPFSAVPKGDDFWKALAQDPVSLIRQLAQLEAAQYVKKNLDPKLTNFEGSLTGIQKTNLVNEFVRDHPDLTHEEEDAMVEILDANPQLKNAPDGLQIAYDRVLAQTLLRERQQASTTNAVAGAKGVAALGGKKTSLPVQKKTSDPFDEVLQADKNEREVFRMGK